jgi:hypothetical protein
MLTVAADAGVDLAELEIVRRKMMADCATYDTVLTTIDAPQEPVLVLRAAIERAIDLLADAFVRLAAHVDPEGVEHAH